MLISEDFNISVTPGFFLLLVLMWYLDRGVALLPWALTACIVHELGHIIAALILKGQVRGLSLTAIGVELCFRHQKVLSYGEENILALSGPAANLLMGITAYAVGAWLPAVISVAIGGFNLMPILPLDGGRVLSNVLEDSLGPPWSERIMTVVTGVLAGILLGIGIISALEYANISLLVTSGWLMLRTLRKGYEKSK